LFNLYRALSAYNPDTDKIIHCYREYIAFVTGNPPSRQEYLQNMELKMTDDEFLGDILTLLRPDETYNPQIAWELIKNELIEKL
jgi:hypothetical protein